MVRRTLALLSTNGCFQRLARVARSEPPRARALLGALGEQIGARPALAQDPARIAQPSLALRFWRFYQDAERRCLASEEGPLI